MLSVIKDASLRYPDADATGCFSPDEPYPEYALKDLSAAPNPVYRAVRQCFAQVGLDHENLGTPRWNPLGSLVPQGSRVFVLCNFVQHRLRSQSMESFRAKCLHASVLRPVLDYLFLAAGPEGRIRVGNAPMWDCEWERVLAETETDKVLDYYHAKGMEVEAKDLRLYKAQRNRTGSVSSVQFRPSSDALLVDLGCDSTFVAHDVPSSARYRIMYHGSSRMNACHDDEGRRHSYVINREILEADVVFGIPKLKTHEKTGITCALKNCVGTVGHKDSLPHHRFGCPEGGGDEYPYDGSRALRLASHFHEFAHGTKPGSLLGNGLRVADRFLRLGLGRRYPIAEGGWWGNDTAWRMVVDLVRAVTYADQTGRLQNEPARRYVALVDGIVGGEGEGPLTPTPINVGLLMFADNPLLADYAAAMIMGYDPYSLPSVARALELGSYPLYTGDLASEVATCNGEERPLADVSLLNTHRFAPPHGWQGRL